jgi:hypothetical protein
MQKPAEAGSGGVMTDDQLARLVIGPVVAVVVVYLLRLLTKEKRGQGPGNRRPAAPE